MKNLVIKEDGILIIKNVRLSYEHVFKAWTKEADKEPKFSATGLLDKKEHKAEIEKLQEMLTERQKTAFKQRIAADRLCLRDGDLSGKPEYEGKMILATSEKIRPYVIDKDGRTPIAQDDDKVYSGCFVNLSFKFWDQNHPKHGKRVNANLIGVQFMSHGEKFSNVERPAADAVFDDEGSDDDGFDS